MPIALNFVKPWMIYAAAIMLWSGGLSAWAYHSGKQSVYTKIAKVESKYMNELNKKNIELQKISAKLRDKQSNTEIVFQTIEKEVIKYVKVTPDVLCFDDRGMHIVKGAAAGKFGDPSAPVTLLPRRVASASERNEERYLADYGDLGEVISRLQGQ